MVWLSTEIEMETLVSAFLTCCCGSDFPPFGVICLISGSFSDFLFFFGTLLFYYPVLDFFLFILFGLHLTFVWILLSVLRNIVTC